MRFRLSSQLGNAPHFVLRVAAPASLALLAGYGIAMAENNARVALVLASAVVGLLLFLLLLRDWTYGIYILFAWLVLDDSLRKYTGEVVILYFYKDFILILTYVAYFLARLSRRERLLNWRSSVVPAIGLLILWGILCSFFSDEFNWSTLVMGLRMWFIYVPLLFLGIDFAQSDTRVRRLFALWIISAALVAVFGLLQVMFGNALLNPIEINYNARLFIEKMGPSGLILIKPTSIFLASGRFGKYLIMFLCVIMGIFIHRWERNRRWCADTIIGAASLGLVFVMNFLTGARIAVVTAPSILSSFLIFLQFRFGRSPGTSIASTRTVLIISIVLIAASGGILAVTSAVSPDFLSAAQDFYVETTVPYMGEHQALHSRDLDFAMRNFLLLGSGVGKTSAGLGYFVTNPAQLNLVETGYASLIVEFGVAGVFVWGWIGLGLVRSSLEAAKVIRNTSFYGLAIAVILFQVLFIFVLFYLGATIYQDYLVSSHLWFLSGLVIGISRKVGQSTDSLLSGISQPGEAAVNMGLKE